MSEADSDATDLADLKKALKLLRGYQEIDANGLPTQKYLEGGEPEEKEARQALARLLRSEKAVDVTVRQSLADMLDPDSASDSTNATVKRRPSPKYAANRTITFRKHPGRSQETVRQDRLGFEVYEAILKGKSAGIDRGRVMGAVRAVAERYGFGDDRAVLNAWTNFREKYREVLRDLD